MIKNKLVSDLWNIIKIEGADGIPLSYTGLTSFVYFIGLLPTDFPLPSIFTQKRNGDLYLLWENDTKTLNVYINITGYMYINYIWKDTVTKEKNFKNPTEAEIKMCFNDFISHTQSFWEKNELVDIFTVVFTEKIKDGETVVIDKIKDNKLYLKKKN